MGAVDELETLLKDQPTNPLRPNQVERYREEKERLDAIVNAPPYVEGDRGIAHTRSRKIGKMLDEQAPKPITDEFRHNRVNKLANEVLENVIRPSMLSRAIMRRNPPGAVDAFNRRENSKEVRRAKTVWKRARWALDPTNDNRDFTNLEIVRPETDTGSVSTFMADAQIPGNFAMSPQAKANWPLGEPTAKTAIAHLDKPAEEPEPVQEIQCECGCGKYFTPKTINQHYVDGGHRRRASNMRLMRGRKQPRKGRLIQQTTLADHQPEPEPPAPQQEG